jgi:DNA polymerase-3 subunit delta'
MAFKDIKGQEGLVEVFRNSVNRDRLAHAYLFLGPEGLGKTLLAKNLAKFLNCENPVKEKWSCSGHEQDLVIDCCDRCVSCRKIEDYNHPDVHWVRPGGRSGRISIDEIRLAQKEISLKTYEGKFKVFIIQDAERMSEQAGNSLLKTLEEPPGKSLIILTCTNISGVLPTIISRCQIVKFRPLHYEKLKEILKNNYGFSPADVHFLVCASEGRIGQALSLKEQGAISKKNRIIDRVCQSGREVSSMDVFNIKDKKELTSQIRYLLNWFRDILIYKSGLPSSSIINADRIEKIKSRASLFSFRELEQIIVKIIKAHRLMEQNVNLKIVLETMLVGINSHKQEDYQRRTIYASGLYRGT